MWDPTRRMRRTWKVLALRRTLMRRSRDHGLVRREHLSKRCERPAAAPSSMSMLLGLPNGVLMESILSRKRWATSRGMEIPREMVKRERWTSAAVRRETRAVRARRVCVRVVRMFTPHTWETPLLFGWWFATIISMPEALNPRRCYQITPRNQSIESATLCDINCAQSDDGAA